MAGFSPRFLAHRSPPVHAIVAPHARRLVALLLEHQDRRRQLVQIHSTLIAHQVFDRRPTPWHAVLKTYSHGPFPQEPPCNSSGARGGTRLTTPAPSYLPSRPALAWGGHGLVPSSMGLSMFEFHACVHPATTPRVPGGCTDLEYGDHWLCWMGRGCSLSRCLVGIVSWTRMIDDTRACRPIEVVALFRCMMAEGINPNEIIVLADVPALSSIGKILIGEVLHCYCQKKGIVCYVWVGNSLRACLDPRYWIQN